ncbi:MAG: dimethylargininase [Acidimicrobiia bacterium]
MSVPLALVRRPGPLLADGLVTHQQREPIDVNLALHQWSVYVDAMSDAGWSISEVEPADDCPDAAFIEDAIVVFDDLAVVARPGALTRRPETVGAEKAARRAGLDIHRIKAPGTLDGGDVLKVDRTAYVGIGERTTVQAVNQLDAILSSRGWSVRPVPVQRVLHLKSAVTGLPDGTIIGYPAYVDDVAGYDRFMAMPEPEGAHVVLLGDDRLLMSSAAPASTAQLAKIGYRPIQVDISEFEKLEGCVTCLSVRIRPPATEAPTS